MAPEEAISFTVRSVHAWYQVDTSLGESQSQSGHEGEEKNICPSWELNPGRPLLNTSRRITVFILDRSFVRPMLRFGPLSTAYRILAI
jgi:hypothetical protein